MGRWLRIWHVGPELHYTIPVLSGATCAGRLTARVNPFKPLVSSASRYTPYRAPETQVMKGTQQLPYL